MIRFRRVLAPLIKPIPSSHKNHPQFTISFTISSWQPCKALSDLPTTCVKSDLTILERQQALVKGTFAQPFHLSKHLLHQEYDRLMKAAKRRQKPVGCSQVSDGQCVILAYKAFLGSLASGGFDDRLRPHLQCCKEQSAKPGKEGGKLVRWLSGRITQSEASSFLGHLTPKTKGAGPFWRNSQELKD
jgi:hypothetical protein